MAVELTDSGWAERRRDGGAEGGEGGGGAVTCLTPPPRRPIRCRPPPLMSLVNAILAAGSSELLCPVGHRLFLETLPARQFLQMFPEGYLGVESCSLIVELNPRCYDPKEELRENRRCPNCACRVYIGAIKTLTVFTHFLLRLIAFQFNIGVIGVKRGALLRE